MLQNLLLMLLVLLLLLSRKNDALRLVERSTTCVKCLAVAFATALFIYIVCFLIITHARARNPYTARARDRYGSAVVRSVRAGPP